jgi:RNA polymerase sigma-54 factor
MVDVAQTIGVHVSTVSRAIAEKWIETPRGVFSMKFFFASAAQKTAPKPMYPYGGGWIAPTPNGADTDPKTRLVILDKLREIIDNENAKSPLSDLEIAEILKKAGVEAARRTVAKYREELKIPSSRLRKKY